jgi:hypothetical protein
LIVDVLIGLDKVRLDGLLAQGLPLPAPITCRGALDTGTDVTAIDPSLVGRLGLGQPIQGASHTALGRANVRLSLASVSITNLRVPSAPMWSFPSLTVMELPAPLPTIEVLIGLDVLLTGQFILDGPGQTFSLDF